jgi:hypothetical protein
MGADGSFTEAPLRPEAPLSEPSLLVAALFSNTAAGTAIALLVSTLLWSRRSQLGFSRRWSSHGADSFEHLHYHVDNFFSQSPYAKGLLLLVITALLVMVGGFMLWISGAGEDASLFSSMWSAWRFVTDGGEYDEGVGPRLVGLVLVLSGMLFFALLVGLIGESIQEKIDSLKHGKGRVLESNHTLVLGWSDKFLHLAREIGKANESEGGGVLVVLCNSKTKQEMDEIVTEELPAEQMRGTKIVCRHGDYVCLSELQKCSAQTARSIVLLAREELHPDMADARAVRTVLALRAGIPSLPGHTVVELRDVDNVHLLDLVAAHGRSATSQLSPVLPMVPHDIMGRLMIQCARQPHLADVYEKLCGFDGDEFYMLAHPSLEGKRWGDALFSFAHACPIGVRQTQPTGKRSPRASTLARADSGVMAGHRRMQDVIATRPRSRLLLNPDDDYVLGPGDEIIVIAEDDDTYEAGTGLDEAPEPGPRPSTRCYTPQPKGAENVLLCGWRRDLLDMLLELDKYVEPGCVVTVLADKPIEQRTALLEEGKACKLELRNVTLEHEVGSTIQQRVLERILHARNYSSVLVLASEDHETNASESDSCALTTLLLVRDVRCTMAQQQGYDPLRHGLTHSASDPGLNGGRTARGAPDRATGGALSRAQVDEVLGPLTLLGEILHSETRDLVAASGVGDYIMSNQLLSKVVAMVAENASVGPLFDTLFSEEGQGIHVRDARAYVGEGEELSFWELGARARADGDVLIGLKLGGDEAVLNPADKRTRRTWQRGDFVIVLSNH